MERVREGQRGIKFSDRRAPNQQEEKEEEREEEGYKTVRVNWATTQTGGVGEEGGLW